MKFRKLPIDLVFASGLLCSPDKLETLCKECHKIRRVG